MFGCAAADGARGGLRADWPRIAPSSAAVDDRTASMFPAVAYGRTLAVEFRHSADVPPGICWISPERLGLLRAESAGSTQAGSI